MDISSKPVKLFNVKYISLTIINMIVSISFYMVSTTISLHVKSLGMSIMDTGTIVGIMSIAAMAIRPLSGWIGDRLNRKLVFILSLLMICLSMIGYGFAKTMPVFVLLRIVHGVSFGICSTVLMALIADYIPQERIGEGMGYFGLGQTLAMAAGPSIGLAIGNSAGFNLTFFISAGFLMAAIVTAFIVTGSARVVPLEHKSASIREFLKPGNFFAKEALLFGAFSITISSVSGLENSFLTLYGKQLGMANIGWYFTLSAFMMFFSRLVFGRIMDKKGFAVIFFPGMAIIASAFILLSRAMPAGAVVLFVVACVLKSVGIGAIQPTLQAQCIKAVKPEKRGAASSTYYFGADIGQGTSPIIGGAIAQSMGYSSAFLLYSLPILLAATLYGLFLGIKKSKQRKIVKSLEN